MTSNKIIGDWSDISKELLSELEEQMYKDTWMKKEYYDPFDKDWKTFEKLAENKVPIINYEDFLAIVDAVSKGETPDWLILKGDEHSKHIAAIWSKALTENAKRKKIEEERLRREAVKKAALDKLTAEEKKILGLK